MVSSQIIYKDGLVTMKLDGLEDILKRLDQVRNDLEVRLLVTAMKRSLVEMLEAAKSRVNVGASVDLFGRPRRPGRLKNSFKLIKVRSTDKFALEVNLVNTAYTAQWVERGHRLMMKVRGKKVPRGKGYVAARPFMRPAFESKKEATINNFSREVQAALKRRGL